MRADSKNETIWLTAEEISHLFGVNRPAVVKHISNIIKDNELEISTCSILEQVQKEGDRDVKRKVNIYNLDMIISIGYRVKSKRGIVFRRWANKVLKEYLIQGVAINQKRIETLGKVVDIQNRMLAYSLNIDKEELVKVIDGYTRALDLLDSYDHQTLEKPKGNKSDYVMTYEEAREIIDSMKFNDMSSVFGVEKEKRKTKRYHCPSISRCLWTRTISFYRRKGSASSLFFSKRPSIRRWMQKNCRNIIHQFLI